MRLWRLTNTIAVLVLLVSCYSPPEDTVVDAEADALLATDRARAMQSDDEGSSRIASAERFFRGIYGGDPSVVDDLAADSIVVSYPIFRSIFGTSTLQGRQAVREFATGFGRRWADPQISIEEVVEGAGRVVLRWSYRARDVGSRPGGPPATNQVHKWTGITIYRFDGTGKIVAELGEESKPIPVEGVVP